MMNFEIFKNTELQLLKTTSEVVEKNGNYFYKSSLFPAFYGGNGISIFNDCFNGDIDKYIETYKILFNLNSTITLNFYSLKNRKTTKENFIKNNIEFEYQNIMIANQLLTKNQSLEKEKFKTPSFEDLLAFEKNANEIEWFYKEGFEKKKLITKKHHINWIGIYEKEQLISCAGYFMYKNYVRLQDVETLNSHFRKGHSKRILNHILKNQEIDKEICLYVDSDNTAAIALYKSVGFEETKEKIVTVFIKNK